MFKITHIGDDYALIETDKNLKVLNREIDLYLAIQLYLAGNIKIDNNKIDKEEWIKLIHTY